MHRRSMSPRGLGPLRSGLVATLVIAAAACASPAPSTAPVTLRLQVSLTPAELASFEPALERVDAAHPEWVVELEPVPQGSESERLTTQLAAGDLPDLVRLPGNVVQQWIRREAFADLSDRLASSGIERSDLFAGPLDQFLWRDRVWGLPDTASPEIVFYDRAAFTEAGLDPPDADWTFDDMRSAAVALTVDAAGRHPADDAFDPEAIERWGWNGGVTYYWQNALIQARGGDLCAVDDCTLMSFTDPADVAAFTWWVGLVRDDHAALYDPYGGSQTGVPGDPFLAGAAAMGSNGTFAIGQLDASGTIDYATVPPLLGTDGQRRTPLSTNGYLIAASSDHADAAWALLEALVEPSFLASTWGEPGHAVPARRSAAGSIPESHRDAILAAMEVGEVFRPYTAGAFDAYGRTIDLFTQMNTGRLGIEEALASIEAAANDALAADREP